MLDFSKLEREQRWIGIALQMSPPMHLMPVKVARWIYRGFDSLFGVPFEAVTKVNHYVLSTADNQSELSLRAYYPDHPQGALVYFHGGGCVIGDLESHDRFCRQLANEAKQVVISVDYRLAPEHPFPAAIEDAISSWNWVKENTKTIGIEGMPLGVAGDSAGGYLAAVLSLTRAQQELKVQATSKPDYQCLIYPLTDQRMELASDFDKGLMLTNALVQYFKKHFLPQADLAQTQLASLISAEELASSPNTYLITAEFDPLAKSGKEYANALRNSGVEVDHLHLEDCMHGFLSMVKVSDRSEHVCRQIYANIQQMAVNNNKASN